METMGEAIWLGFILAGFVVLLVVIAVVMKLADNSEDDLRRKEKDAPESRGQ